MYETYIHDYLSVTALATIAFLAPIIIGFMLSIGFKFLGRGRKFDAIAYSASSPVALISPLFLSVLLPVSGHLVLISLRSLPDLA